MSQFDEMRKRWGVKANHIVICKEIMGPCPIVQDTQYLLSETERLRINMLKLLTALGFDFANGHRGIDGAFTDKACGDALDVIREYCVRKG